MFKSIWDAPSTSDYFNSLWDTSDMADAWADYGDYAEDVWSDEDWDMTEDEAESFWHGAAEDAAMEAGLFGWDA
jgi:hypothetical protein